VVSYYDGVLDEMNTYDDSDGFACFLFERGGSGGRERRKEREKIMYNKFEGVVCTK
jgi:hypothetical protein